MTRPKRERNVSSRAFLQAKGLTKQGQMAIMNNVQIEVSK